MKKQSAPRAAFFNVRVLVGSDLSLAGVILALLSLSVNSSRPALAAVPKQALATFGVSSHNDVSPALRDMPASPSQFRQPDAPNLIADKGTLLSQLAPSIPLPMLNFAGIAGSPVAPPPPDMTGEAGATQHVQMAVGSYQIFDNATGNAILGT